MINYIITKSTLQDAVARLLNAVASTQKGRTYMSTIDIVPLLFFGENLLGAHQSDRPRISLAETTAENLIAAAFKLSLVAKPRTEMLHRHVTEWMIHHLIDMQSSPLLSPYHLRSITSLLLVLLSYKPQLRSEISECLTLLERYLSNPSPESNTNIINIMLVLLSNPNIKSHAVIIGLGTAIMKRQEVSGWKYSIYLTTAGPKKTKLHTE